MASQFVAIEFDESEIRVVGSQNQGKQVRVRSAFSVPLSDDDTDEQISKRLKDGLSSGGISRADAIIVVNRGQVEIREVTVPPVPENELPGLVKFKAKSEFASATENWQIDFFPLS